MTTPFTVQYPGHTLIVSIAPSTPCLNAFGIAIPTSQCIFGNVFYTLYVARLVLMLHAIAIHYHIHVQQPVRVHTLHTHTNTTSKQLHAATNYHQHTNVRILILLLDGSSVSATTTGTAGRRTHPVGSPLQGNSSMPSSGYNFGNTQTLDRHPYTYLQLKQLK